MLEIKSSITNRFNSLKYHSYVLILILLIVLSILSNARTFSNVSLEFEYVSDHEILDENYKISDDHPLVKNSNETSYRTPTMARSTIFDNQSKRGPKPLPVNRTNLIKRLSIQSEISSSNEDFLANATSWNNLP